MEDIIGFEGEYAVTRDGKIWSHKTNRFLKLRGSGQTGSVKRHKRKYKTIALWKIGKGYCYYYVHRLVAIAYIPNPKELPFINHVDGNPVNNYSENLEWCTNIENLAHAFRNGLTTRGEKNSQTKLTQTQVIEIRKFYKAGGISQSELGKRYAVSQGAIYMIVKRKNWSWLP